MDQVPALSTGSTSEPMATGGSLNRFWRLLPRPARQALYGYITGIGLERVRPGTPDRLPEPVVVVGVLRAPTGLGQAARLALAALKQQGVAVAAVDLTGLLLQPVTESPVDAPAIVEGAGTLLIYLPPPNLARGLAAIPRGMRAGKTVVAGWVCETETLPAIWRQQADYCHILTAPSRFAADAISASTGRPVKVIGHPVAAVVPAFEALPALHEQPRIGAVLDVGSSASRKDVAGLAKMLGLVLEAEPGINLVLKMRDVPSDPASADLLAALVARAPTQVSINDRDETSAETESFLDSLDMLVSMSRAEGFGLPLAEALLRGIPVAAPFWGGPTDFLTDQNAIALPYQLEPIADQSGLYTRAMGRWACVDPNGAAGEIISAIRAQGWRQRKPCRPPIFEPQFFVKSLMSAGQA
jgi:hypothetical protein